MGIVLKEPPFRATKGTPLWQEARDALAAEFPDLPCAHPENGEVWKYLGTFYIGGEWRHVFRHRCLPNTGKLEYREYPATDPLPEISHF